MICKERWCCFEEAVLQPVVLVVMLHSLVSERRQIKVPQGVKGHFAAPVGNVTADG